MEQRYVGRSGLRVSDLGLGTATWGREADSDAAAAQLAAFRDAGGTLVDLAASDRAETILGTLPAAARADLVVATTAGIECGPNRMRTVDASRGALLGRLEDSLRRLRVDHIDLWQTDSVDPNVPIEETLSALDHAVASGKARYVGVANYPGWRVAQAATWQACAPGRAPVVVNQVEYSLLARGVEREVVPACLALGVGLICSAPLGAGVLTRDVTAGGMLAGIGRDAGAPPPARRSAGPAPPAAAPAVESADPRTVGLLEAVATAADGLATSALAVALSWIRGRPGVASAVVQARTVAQLNAILQARSVQIPQAIRRALDEVSAPVPGYPEEVG